MRIDKHYRIDTSITTDTATKSLAFRTGGGWLRIRIHTISYKMLYH